jgi:DNA-binding NarL/FixJ family response regulator
MADDHPAHLAQVLQILNDEFEILAMASDGETALNTALALQPDIVILDFAMPRRNGIQTARELRKRGFRSAILFLTIQADPDYMEVLADLGAGYVSKLKMQTELVPAIRAALAKQR